MMRRIRMNNRHRRVAKLRKQELNVLKAKFEKEYGVSVEEAYKVLSQCVAERVMLFVSLEFRY